MANAEHLERLKQGVAIWNQWREYNPKIEPNLNGANLSGCDLDGANLSRAKLCRTNLSKASLCRANLRSAKLWSSNLHEAHLHEANLWKAELNEASLNRTDLSGANLRDANLHDAALCDVNLSGVDLRDINLKNLNLRGVNLSRVDLRDIDLSCVNLSCVNLSRANLSGVDLRGLDLSGVNLSETNLSGVILRDANLRGANLNGVDLRSFDLSNIDLRGANLSGADLRGFDLCKRNLSEVNLSGADLRNTCLSSANLSDANLRSANLGNANLSSANLSSANLSCTNLSDANLSEAQILGTCFEQAVFTGACLQDCNSNSDTRFDDAICEYIYLKANQQERRPREGTFKPGEFAALFQRAVDTVDLIFKDGIDWQAFFQSFKKLRSQYLEQDLSIQAIEKKRDDAFVVRVEVPPEIDKTVIESRIKEFYTFEINALEAQYEARLRLQGQHLEDARQTIEVERREKATLMGVMATMANSQQGPKYDMRGAQFAGGFAETVQGDQIGGTINNTAAETPSLAEAAAEIQNLLKQLEASNPTATEADQTAFLNVMIPPTKRERFIGALKAASGAAIEEVPYGSVLKALVEGWQNPNG